MITQVTYERVFNLGGYESERISATVTVEDTAEAAYDEARAAVATEHARTLAARQEIVQQSNGGASYTEPPASDRQRAYIATLQDKIGWHSEQLAAYASEQGMDLATLTKSQASTFIDGLKRLADQTATEEGIVRWAQRAVTPAATEDDLF